MRLHKGFFAFLTLCVFSGLTACSKGGQQGMPPAMVPLGAVKSQDWQSSVVATGTVNAIQGAQLKAEVAGRITKVYFTSGQTVHTGDPLIDINPLALEAAYKSAKATAVFNEANYRRSVILFHKKFISQQDMDTALSNKETSEAALHVAEANLAEAKVKAPFDGTVGINLVNVGDYVAIGDALFNIEQLNQLRIDFVVPENLSGFIHLGDRVVLTVKDNPGAPTYTGKVIGLDTAIDQSTRMLAVRAVFANDQKDTHILPGSFAEARLYYGPRTRVAILPQTAVVSDAEVNSVYLVDKGHAKLTPVKLGERFADQVVAISGIQPGAMIVTSGIVKVHDGDAVVDPAMMAAAMAKQGSKNEKK